MVRLIKAQDYLYVCSRGSTDPQELGCSSSPVIHIWITLTSPFGTGKVGTPLTPSSGYPMTPSPFHGLATCAKRESISILDECVDYIIHGVLPRM